MVGIIQTELQIRTFLRVDTVGMYVFRVMVRSVTMAMAKTEKSAAWTDHWPTQPLTTHTVPGLRSWRLATA